MYIFVQKSLILSIYECNYPVQRHPKGMIELERFGGASRASFKHPHRFNFIRLTPNPRNIMVYNNRINQPDTFLLVV